MPRPIDIIRAVLARHVAAPGRQLPRIIIDPKELPPGVTINDEIERLLGPEPPRHPGGALAIRAIVWIIVHPNHDHAAAD